MILGSQDLIAKRVKYIMCLGHVEEQFTSATFRFFGLLQSVEHERQIIAACVDISSHDETIKEILDDGHRKPQPARADAGTVS